MSQSKMRRCPECGGLVVVLGPYGPLGDRFVRLVPHWHRGFQCPGSRLELSEKEEAV